MSWIVILAITPPIIIAYYIIFSDKFTEPAPLLIKTFLLGFLITIPAGVLNNIFIWSKINSYELTYIAGIIEESLKFLILHIFIKKKIDFNEPMDAIVYGTLISLGFATIENIEYVFEGEFNPYSIAIFRMFTAIPAHASFGIIMGYYYGMYAFNNDRSYLLKSLFFPIIAHSIYNYSTQLGPIFFLISLLIFYSAWRAHKIFVNLQREKLSENEKKLI